MTGKRFSRPGKLPKDRENLPDRREFLRVVGKTARGRNLDKKRGGANNAPPRVKLRSLLVRRRFDRRRRRLRLRPLAALEAERLNPELDELVRVRPVVRLERGAHGGCHPLRVGQSLLELARK